MKKNLILCLVALAMFMGLSVMAAEKAAKEKKLVGMLALSKADDPASALVLKIDEKKTVAVATTDEAVKKQLADLVGKKVELTGVVTEKEHAKTITVTAVAEVKAEEKKAEEKKAE
jgi:hypothetical protein